MLNKYLYSYFTFFVLLLAACGAGDGGLQERDLEKAKGDKYYGGIFRMNEVEYFRSLYPHNVTEVGGHRLTNQIYEGLVGLDQGDLTIVPVIAKSWEVDSQATEFIFHLREDVYYHDDPCFPDGKGRNVTAHDFKYVFTRLCASGNDNQGYWVFEDKVQGCKDYYLSTLDGSPLPEGVTGVEVLDDYTLKITLEKPFAAFLNLLALPFTAVFPEEAVEKYGRDMRTKTVGTGPFYVKAMKTDETVILSKNPNYWGKDEAGNQLPYLDGIRFSYIKERKSELLELRQGNLDMIYRLPLEMVNEVVGPDEKLKPEYKNFELQSMANMSVQYYGFQHWSDLFENKNLRIAFNYAVDRQKICSYTLKGTGIPGHYGIVPPAMTNYDAKALKGYEFNPDKARNFMEKAGYPNGAGFPEITLQINSGGGTNEQVAEAVQSMLSEVLNIKINITKLPFAQHLENLETGKVDFWRAGWIADYPDPENFLNLFYSKHIPEKLEDKSYLNSTRYKNPKFDALFEEALQTVDDDQRNLLYLKAEQQMLDDAAIIPLFYYKDYRLLQPNVKNFPQNAMEHRNLREVYFVPVKNPS
ncbi:MAG: ABC transporter substrate-binding protein [Chitinophagales bacterium]